MEESSKNLLIKTTDMHTAGEPLRIVEKGYPELIGKTLLEKMKYAKECKDNYRKLLMHEPRGHYDMYGAVLLEPVDPRADISVLFLNNEAYSTMCGHAVIGLGRYAVDKEIVKSTPPETKVVIECPCGIVNTYVENSSGRVRFHSVPSFVYELGMIIHTPEFKELKIDIVYGGAFYVILEASAIGMDLENTPLRLLTEAADNISGAVKSQISLSHPDSLQLGFLYGTILTDGKDESSDDSSVNICFFADKQVDRSPTGSGVSARIALQYKRKQLPLQRKKEFKSLIGTSFTGQAISETKCGDFEAVIVEVSGTSHYMGENTFILEKSDPLPSGFQLKI